MEEEKIELEYSVLVFVLISLTVGVAIARFLVFWVGLCAGILLLTVFKRKYVTEAVRMILNPVGLVLFILFVSLVVGLLCDSIVWLW